MPPELAQLGLAGLVIFTLAGVVLYQQKKIDTLYKEKDVIQTERLADAKEFEKRYRESLETFSQTSKLLLAKLSGKEEK